MKIEKKTYIQKKLFTYLFSLILAFLIFIYSIYSGYRKYSENVMNAELLNYEINELYKHTYRVARAVNEVDGAKKFSLDLTDKSKQETGIQYDRAKLIIAKLMKMYNIYPASTVYATTQKNIGKLKYNISDSLVVSEIKIDLRTATDTQAIQFLDSLMLEFPGFVKIEYFRLSKNVNIHKELLNDLANGIDRTIVKSEIGLEWYDFLKNN